MSYQISSFPFIFLKILIVENVFTSDRLSNIVTCFTGDLFTHLSVVEARLHCCEVYQISVWNNGDSMIGILITFLLRFERLSEMLDK
jgi:hypothetical protein